MKSSTKPLAIVLFVLFASFTIKLVLPQPHASDEEDIDKAAQLGAFLRAKGAAVQKISLRTMWGGWRVRTGFCEAVAMPSLWIGDGEDVTRVEVHPGEVYTYIFQGKFYQKAPNLQVRALEAKNWLFWPFMPKRWHRPIVVVLIMPKDCRSAERIAWKELWESRWGN